MSVSLQAGTELAWLVCRSSVLNAEELARSDGLKVLGRLVQRWIDTPAARALLSAGSLHAGTKTFSDRLPGAASAILSRLSSTLVLTASSSSLAETKSGVKGCLVPAACWLSDSWAATEASWCLPHGGFQILMEGIVYVMTACCFGIAAVGALLHAAEAVVTP
eukprot:scaffold191039_cov19-Tisochrysis_lutea.AAC.1